MELANEGILVYRRTVNKCFPGSDFIFQQDGAPLETLQI